MNENIENMSFQDYYSSLKTQYTVLRDKICKKLGISEKTFYNRLSENNFTYPEQVVISEIIGKPHHELFPNKESEKVA